MQFTSHLQKFDLVNVAPLRAVDLQIYLFYFNVYFQEGLVLCEEQTCDKIVCPEPVHMQNKCCPQCPGKINIMHYLSIKVIFNAFFCLNFLITVLKAVSHIG